MTTVDPISIPALAATLLEGARADGRGRDAHIVVKEPILRTTMIALLAGRSLAEHNTPAAATLQCLQGHALLKALDQEWSLTEGSLVAIPPARHSVDAVTDCVLLLTVAFPE